MKRRDGILESKTSIQKFKSGKNKHLPKEGIQFILSLTFFSELAQERARLLKLKDNLDSKSRQLEISNLPTRKDKEELDSSKNQIIALQAELKDLSAKNKASIDRMKQTINVLTVERSEFQSKYAELVEQNKKELEFKVGSWNREKVNLNKQIKELKEKIINIEQNNKHFSHSETVVDLKSNKNKETNQILKPTKEIVNRSNNQEASYLKEDDASNLIIEVF